jgi:hypothetical protein
MTIESRGVLAIGKRRWLNRSADRAFATIRSIPILHESALASLEPPALHAQPPQCRLFRPKKAR